MRWEHFDWQALLLHLAAIAVAAGLVLALEHGIGHSEKGRVAALLSSSSALFGTICYAMLFDGGLLWPFDWRSLGMIVFGTGMAAFVFRLLVRRGG